MDFRYLLVQSIALLFWEANLPNGGMDSRNLITEVIKTLPAPDSLGGSDEDRENMVALRDIAAHMAAQKEQISDRQFLLNKLKLNIKKDPELREDIENALKQIDDVEVMANHVKLLHGEIVNYFHQRDFKEEIKRIAAKTIFANAGNFTVGEMAKAISATMERFVNATTDGETDPSLNDKGDSSDVDDLARLFTNVQEDLAPDSIIKTGWQAFNRMCGELGGLRRGNMYVIGARPSNGKSLVSSCLTFHTMLYNTPYMFDETKKPCVVHISTENDLPLNMKIWYRYLWENIMNEPCNMQDQDPASMAKWFKEKVEENGYKFIFYHINPTNTAYRDIITKLMQIESEGYEIHLVNVDYLAMITNDGLGDENRAFWIQQLFKVMRNYTNPRRITLLTPHQVSPDSALLLRQGATDFVRQIAGKRYWAGCKAIDMEVDMEIVLNIERVGKGADSKTYMAFGRGKDRSTQGTPEEDCFFFLPFDKVGGLRADIYGKDTSKRNIRDENAFDTVNIADWMGAPEE